MCNTFFAIADAFTQFLVTAAHMADWATEVLSIKSQGVLDVAKLTFKRSLTAATQLSTSTLNATKALDRHVTQVRTSKTRAESKKSAGICNTGKENVEKNMSKS